MATLYIMCGLPFSGKTTLAQKIADYTNSQLIRFDKVWQEYKLQLPFNKNDEWKFILEKAQSKIKDFLCKGISVVYDDINVRYEHREKLRDIAKECDADSIVVFLNTPMSEIKNREERNNLSKKRHRVKQINFNNAIKQFQRPNSRENVKEYNPEMNVDIWLKELSLR